MSLEPTDGLVRHDAPEESRMAAKAIAQSVGTLRMLVLRILADAPHGLTDQEMQLRTGLANNCQNPRRLELERLGLVERNGERRPTKSGRQAAVWVATAKGMAIAQGLEP